MLDFRQKEFSASYVSSMDFGSGDSALLPDPWIYHQIFSFIAKFKDTHWS